MCRPQPIEDIGNKPIEVPSLMEQLTQLINEKDKIIEEGKEERIRLQKQVELLQKQVESLQKQIEVLQAEIGSLKEKHIAESKPSLSFPNMNGNIYKCIGLILLVPMAAIIIGRK